MSREYKLEIDPGILEILGPNLYTNIYYVLAELIANSYDADAKNVYIMLNNDYIHIEDDGHGMSYKAGEVEKYLKVARISRTTDSESVTKNKGRQKMGRKGLGKLSALAVSENVDVLTIANGEKSGFVLSRHIGNDRQLKEIPDEKIIFNYVKDNGSAIIMQDPQYQIHKTVAPIKKNILKLFPLVSEDFRIHIIRGDETPVIIEKFDQEIIKKLCALITLGEKFKPLCDLVPNEYPENHADLVKAENQYAKTINMKAKDGKERPYSLEISGWIGAYKSTSRRKLDRNGDFPDSFISLFANGKLGEFNILPVISQNQLDEVYIVGQLHIDLFELTELPDMALSNRQGYKSDDLRYKEVQKYVESKLLPNITKMRNKYVDLRNEQKNKKKEDEKIKNEEKLKVAVDRFREKTSKEISNDLIDLGTNIPHKKIGEIALKHINANSHELGLKPKVDSDKKKILISQTIEDKPLADIIYKMLLFNNVPSEDILYTNCDDEECRIPEGKPVYDFLRDNFVNSYSTQKIHVLFVTSKNMETSWGALMEVGASWIIRCDHKIFNITPCKPQNPLNIGPRWHDTRRDEASDLYMNSVNADIFCEKIEAVCDELGFPKKQREENKNELSRLVSFE